MQLITLKIMMVVKTVWSGKVCTVPYHRVTAAFKIIGNRASPKNRTKAKSKQTGLELLWFGAAKS